MTRALSSPVLSLNRASPRSGPPRAVVLISGGLDSMLAARVVMHQGVHVEGINFYTGFCVEGHTHAIRRDRSERPRRNNALWVAEQLGIKLHLIDVVEDYKQVVLGPHFGYGTNLNPCLDCKIFMVHRAYQWMQGRDFDFVVTGEVMGQRPKSQLKAKLPLVAERSGASDRLLRPLSAKLLEPTLPEREGWVDREALFDFHGRSRRPQIALAKALGVTEYAQPAGGCCFLTDPNYTAKLKDLWRGRGVRDYERDDVMLLKVGRHLRPRPHFKTIIAREEGENHFLSGFSDRYPLLRPLSHPGPVALIDGQVEAADLVLAARLTARYSRGRDGARVAMEVCALGVPPQTYAVAPLPASEVLREWYV